MNKQVKVYDINYFSYLEHPAVYADKDFFALSPLNSFPDFSDDVRLNCLLMLFCMEGQLCVRLNEKDIELSAGVCMIVPPNSLLGHATTSPGCVATLLGYSLQAVSSLLQGSQEAWRLFTLLTQRPLIYNDQRYLHDRMRTFLNILRYRTRNNDPYIEQLSYHLFAALFFDVINDIRVPHIADSSVPSGTQGRYRAESIYQQFLMMLNEDDGEHRSVAYFAEKLCISPKYLSKIVRAYTQQSAQHVILAHVVERLKVELKHSDLSMKQISEKFHFENYPAFCKFVKSHLGITARQFRAGLKASPAPDR